MAMITDNVTAAQVIAQAAAELLALRTALLACQKTQSWLAGIALTDLEAAPPAGLGFTPLYAQAIKSAYADADAIRLLYQTGLPPATYPQPSSAYPYANSQAPIIGV